MSLDWRTLDGDIDACMLIDQPILRRRFRQLRQATRRPSQKATQRLLHDIGISKSRRANDFETGPRSAIRPISQSVHVNKTLPR